MSFLPITDFQFVFCGFATFAATVGYACARRRSSINQESAPVVSPSTSREQDSISSNSPALDEKASSDTEPMSLKRKSTDDQEPSDRPRKRSRSPSHGAGHHTKSIMADSPKPFATDLPSVTQPTCTEAEDITMNQETPVVVNQQTEPKPLARPMKESTEIEAEVITMPITPRSSPPPANRARGFAAFAGTGSTFNANGTATVPSQHRPVWCSNGNPLDAQLTTENNISKTDDAIIAETFGSTNRPSPLGVAFGPNQVVTEVSSVTATPARAQTVAHLTGEEDETIKSELKGVKLFVKRGAKAFTGGMPGHIKLLSHTQSSEERLLFRREPLWKVSMNVRVQPAVRCTFDSEDNVLRIVLKEAVEDSDGPAATRPQELVVYALKRGRVSKKEFKEFAEALVANPLFQSARTPNENTA